VGNVRKNSRDMSKLRFWQILGAVKNLLLVFLPLRPFFNGSNEVMEKMEQIAPEPPPLPFTV
jgi:hypothetical protein